MNTYRILTLGCKVNQAESYELSEALNQAGLCESVTEPTICIINTCAVTRASESKSRRLIRRVRKQYPNSKLIVTGCYATSNLKEINEVGGVDLIVPQEDKGNILHLLVSNGLLPSNCTSQNQLAIKSNTSRTRAVLKIQDGCDYYCSYCIIPYLRGRPRSKPLSEVIKEAEQLIGKGYKEIVLTGINLGCYGEDFSPPTSLVDLLRQLVKISQPVRIRLSSIELEKVTDEMVTLIKEYSSTRRLLENQTGICPHLHIPLQSGSNRILHLMNRRYTREQYLQRISEIRSSLPNLAFTTDVMVGFPGEEVEDFEETLKVVQIVGFSKIHIFPYSLRPMTLASKLTGHVPSVIIKQREKKLSQVARMLALKFKENFIGKVVQVLIEGNGSEGLTEHYLRVRLKDGKKFAVNQLISVVIEKAFPDYLLGNYYENN